LKKKQPTDIQGDGTGSANNTNFWNYERRHLECSSPAMPLLKLINQCT